MNLPGPSSVAAWLDSLGLAQYADLLAEQAIELDLLPELSETQWQQIGIGPLGHRIKLMRAAAALRAAPSASAAAAVTPAPAPAPAPAPRAIEPAAERRQITVLFCDLVGSTALSQTLDPEDLRALMQRYQRACGDAVQRHQGTVAQYLGDGLMVYFGWPRAYEDDAQRAVAAALAIVETVQAMQGLPSDAALQVRVGLATGPVVVGANDTTAGAGAIGLPHTAVGETPNRAARVQGQAEPGQVLLADDTHRLLGADFDCEDLGERELKGIAEPLRLWRVLRENSGAGRFEARRGRQLTPMVNRDLELSLLVDRWARAAEGQGQAVLLIGEPGIGKSRLLAELVQRLPEGSQGLRLQCSELHGHSAFHPFIAQLLARSGIERGDAPAARLAKLEAMLRRDACPAEPATRLFAELLSIPAPHYQASSASPAKQRHDTISALVQWATAAARQQPLMVLAEDLHWMDPSSLEAVDALVAALRRLRVLLVLTSRNALPARGAAPPHLTALSMVGLNRSHSMELARKMAIAHGLQQSLMERIVERTEGVPLYLEELTRTVAEGHTHRRGQGGEFIEIPDSLKASLTARLDALGPARRLLQLGAVLGRSFRHDMLAALHGADDAAFDAQLERAMAAGLIERSGRPPEALYTFHHALIQDAAYETLLKSDRRAFHEQAADLLSRRFAELADTEPELLARHYAAGEAWDRAVPLWLKAGQRAWARGAAKEATVHLEAGIAAVGRMSDAALGDRVELGLQSTLGVVSFAAVGYTSQKALAALSRADALCKRLAQPELTMPVLYGVGTYETVKGNTRAGHAAFERVQAAAEATQQQRLKLHVQAALAWTHSSMARHPAALEATAAARRLVAQGALSGPRIGAGDPRLLSECFGAVSLWSIGRVDEALAASDAMLELARTLDPFSQAYALCFAALVVPGWCGQHERVATLAQEGVALALELGYPHLEVSGRLEAAWSGGGALAGDVAAALSILDAQLERYGAMGVGHGREKFLCWRAQLQLAVGDMASAQLSVAEALGCIESSGTRVMEVEVGIVEGAVLRAHGGEQRGLAESALQTALETARLQQALSWELRAALALAELKAEDGEPAAARALLEPVYERFTEGRSTADHRRTAMRLAQWS